MDENRARLEALEEEIAILGRGAAPAGGAVTARLTPLADRLPASVPFVGPEAQERARGAGFVARLGANESVFGPSPLAVAAMAAGGGGGLALRRSGGVRAARGDRGASRRARPPT